jgi:hypothetical protein
VSLHKRTPCKNRKEYYGLPVGVFCYTATHFAGSAQGFRRSSVAGYHLPHLADWCGRPATRRVMTPAWSMRSARTRMWVSVRVDCRLSTCADPVAEHAFAVDALRSSSGPLEINGFAQYFCRTTNLSSGPWVVVCSLSLRQGGATSCTGFPKVDRRGLWFLSNRNRSIRLSKRVWTICRRCLRLSVRLGEGSRHRGS